MTISGAELPAIPDVLIDDENLRGVLLALKTIAEIREGRHIDTGQRFVTYYELVSYLSGENQLVVEAVTAGHNHDPDYSAIGHDHDAVYSLLSHNHDALYSLLGHDHNAVYSLLTHEHDADYSAIDHDHDAEYSGAAHNHALADLSEKSYTSLTNQLTGAQIKTLYEGEADTNEFSDAEQTKLLGIATGANLYVHPASHAISVITGLQAELDAKSSTSHNHNLADLAERAYSSLTGTPTIPANHSDLVDDEATKHRLINDAGTLTTELWSASKILAQLALLSAIGHHHDAAYEALGHDHDSDYSGITHDHDSDYSGILHNHNLADLTERAYANLTGKPTIPANHSDLSDDEAAKHRLINDAGTTATVLWSASKIIAQLALKSETTHDHDSDYPAIGHDHDSDYSLIAHEHDADYSDILHNHNLADLTERAYASLTGKPTIPSAHSDLSDDEATKHRLINDAGSTTTVLWSASKIIAQLALYSLDSHNHNLADLTEKAYSSLTGRPTIPSDHSDLADDEAAKHRLISDAGSSTTVLWSASKIIAQLALKSATSHNHDADYSDISHDHDSDYPAIGHNHDSDYSDILHNHNLADLTEKAYSSLTGRPTIPADHSDLNDDETAKHRLINDSGSTTTVLWSASKIIAQLALKSATSHNHNLNDLTEKAYSSLTGAPTIPSAHSDLSDDEATKHRLISDAGSSTTVLWSASKIIAQLALKSATSHEHDADYEALGHDHDTDYEALGHGHATSEITDIDDYARAAGYNSNDRHSTYTGDLDDIAVNSLYNFSGGTVTNEPTFIGSAWGFVWTQMHTNSISYRAQFCWGMNISGPRLAFRKTQDSGVTWTAWTEFYNENFPPAHSEITEDEAEKHRLINDSGTLVTELFSASKIIAELALKSATTHNHNLNDLAEKAYSSLTGAPTIPANHSDLSDDEATKHRLINDAGTLTTELFSASKIIADLALKSPTTHDHDSDYSDITHEHDTLEYSGVTAIEAVSAGATIADTTSNNPTLDLDNYLGTTFARIKANTTDLYLQIGSAYETGLKIVKNGALELYYDNTKEAETISGALKATNAFNIAGTTQVDEILDEDDMASNSATGLVTQQSIVEFAKLKEPRRNHLINGDCDFWTRTTTPGALAHGEMVLDRFKYYKAGAMVQYCSQSANGPSLAEAGRKIAWMIPFDVTTADTSLAAGDYAEFSYLMEGTDLKPLWGNDICLSFWVKHYRTGTYCVSFQPAAAGASYVCEYTVNVSNTWEFKSVTLTLDDTIGTWTFGEALGMYINFIMAAGSTYHGTANQWNADSKFATSNQVNAVQDAANDICRFAGMKLEIGTEPTPWVAKNYNDEKSQCERYCQVATYSTTGWQGTSNYAAAPILFHTSMVTAPGTTPVETDAVFFAAYNCPTSSAFNTHKDGANALRQATAAAVTGFSGSAIFDAEFS